MTNFITDAALAVVWDERAAPERMAPLARQVALALANSGPGNESDGARILMLRDQMGPEVFLPWVSSEPGYPAAVAFIAMVADALEFAAQGVDVASLRDVVQVPAQLHDIVGDRLERFVLLDVSAVILGGLRERRLSEAQALSKAALELLIRIADHVDTPAWVANRSAYRDFAPLLDFDAREASAQLEEARAAHEAPV